MNELIILVDEQDQEIGFGEKLDVHVKEQLHRAFSIFIFDPKKQQMLIQKRAQGKYHSGGKWSNACCSHPRKGEIMEEALARRLQEELGFVMPERLEIFEYPKCPPDMAIENIIEVGHFTYYAKFKGLAEYEIDHVFVYYPSQEQVEKMRCNPEEIEDIQWVHLEKLIHSAENEPERYSAWFKKSLNLALILLKPSELP